MKTALQKVRRGLNTKLGFFLLTVLLFAIKSYWAYKTKFNLWISDSMQQFLLAFNTLPGALVFLGIALYFRGRLSYWLMILINFLLSTWLFANILYYREFSDFITFNIIKGSGAASNNLGKSLMGIIKPTDFLVYADVIILIVLLAAHFIRIDMRYFKVRYAMTITMIGFVLFGANLAMAEKDRPQLLTRTFDNNYIVKYLGLQAYTIYDGVKTTHNSAVKARTSGCTEHPIVLYEYQPNRKAEHAEEFLKGFSGWLHADGYHGYHRLPENIRVVGCWAHARRKFDEALQTLLQEKRKDSLAAAGECYCSRLFQLEKSFAELTPEERHAKRLEQEKPVLDALLAWANAASGKAAPKSALGRALHYLLEQWPYLIRYLEDGRLELSNNRAERSIKPFVMGRKNWLFANTPGGAQSSSVIYSLIETAKENGLDPYRYLLWVLRNAPAMSQMDEAWAEQLLPASAPQECRIPKE